MSDQVKVGDIVILKSGGPRMTVEWIGANDFTDGVVAQCKWFGDKAKVSTDSFKPALLEVVND